MEYLGMRLLMFMRISTSQDQESNGKRLKRDGPEQNRIADDLYIEGRFHSHGGSPKCLVYNGQAY